MSPRPEAEVAAPDFPPATQWLNAPFVRMGTLLGRNAALVWFWDFASLNSLRALPYVREWHRRYAGHNLRVIGVHSPQFDFGQRLETVAAAVERLGIEFPVAHDHDFAIWRLYGNEVWPALYLWDRRGVLRHFHFAEGAYDETEAAIGEVLREIDERADLPAPMRPLRATDVPHALVHPPTPHRYLEPDRSGRPVAAGEQLSIRYAGGSAAAVLDGHGSVDVLLDGDWLRALELDGPRLYELVDTERHERHEVTLVFGAPAVAYAFSFAPAVSDDA